MRFSGTVGYIRQAETRPGVWEDQVTERSYIGDVVRASRHLDAPSQAPPVVNGDISLRNSFSIVGDDHAYGNFKDIKYVQWDGTAWTVTDVEIRRPRLILTIGAEWRGKTG